MMESEPPGRAWPRVLVLGAGAVLSLATMVWAIGLQEPGSLQAGQESSGEAAAQADSVAGADDPTVLDDEGRFTGPGDVWPPQPRGATGIVERVDADLAPVPEDVRLGQIDAEATPNQAPSAVVAADVDVQAALGAEHNLIAAEEIDGSTRLIYYSLSTNQTVDLTIAGGAVSELTLLAPGRYQPPLSDDEKQAAVDIARAHWQSKGDSRINSLEGFAILAFQPGGAYYDTRMAYVSFHVDADSRPELLAWVDLVAGDVIRSEVDR